MIKGTIKTKGYITGSIDNQTQTLNANMSIPKSAGVQDDYDKLKNLPQIESVTLQGNKTFDELGMSECSNQDIINLFKE